MNTDNLFIFSSNELFLLNNNTLPQSVPQEFEELRVDAFNFPMGDERATVVSLRRDQDSQAPACALGYWIPLRAILGSTDPVLSRFAAPASRALGLGNWHKETRFCLRCGGALNDHEKENARHCPACGNLLFPRLSPAIITLVRKGGEILLAKHSNRNTAVWACIAGYLEHGESLEDCVAREVKEETGLTVANIRYAGSQSWPFPDQFMIAFFAEWVSGDIVVDPSEIAEARWFSRDSLPATPPPGTVAWGLINAALRGNDNPDRTEIERFVLTPRP